MSDGLGERGQGLGVKLGKDASGSSRMDPPVDVALINLDKVFRNRVHGRSSSMAFSTLLYIHGTAEHIVECIFQSITSSKPGLLAHGACLSDVSHRLCLRTRDQDRLGLGR